MLFGTLLMYFVDFWIHYQPALLCRQSGNSSLPLVFQSQKLPAERHITSPEEATEAWKWSRRVHISLYVDSREERDIRGILCRYVVLILCLCILWISGFILSQLCYTVNSVAILCLLFSV
jgi:hypothetical protein